MIRRLFFPRRLLGVLLLALGLAACYTNPETGRRALVLFSPEEEAALGLQAFTEIKNETPISTDPEENAQTQRVGQKVSSVVELPHAEWEFVVFDKDDTPNAFCLPGGKVGIYTGILPITQNDNGLAVVMGHEVAHAAARHGGERMSHQLMVALGGIGLAVALREKPKETQALALIAYGVTTTVGHILPHSRRQELEADYMGLKFMAKAGYDPRGSVDFWRRFKAYGDKQGDRVPEFLSTHPLDERRIRELEKRMPEALKIYHETVG
ncbi:MAG: M48 family metallopeptidase [Calditrichaeota bacterium]|nr:M48 family metallopeptidase [Calditrichota bacterium]